MFYKGLLFDLDNTIYSYTKCHDLALDECINYLLTICDMSYNILKNMYKSISINLKNELQNTASSHNKSIYLKHLTEELNLNYLHSIKLNEIYWTIFYKNITPFDYVIDFIKWNKSKNIKIGIITDYETEFQILKLQKLNLLEYIDCIVTSEEIGIEKPSYKIFNTILNKMKLQTHEVIMFGDNFEKDIIGAENLDIKTILVDNKTNIFSYQKLLHDFQNIHTELEHLKNISKYCGERFDLVQAGGGNISVKYDELMFIKASGYNLATVDEFNGYVTVNNKLLLNDISNNNVGPVLTYNYIGNKRGSIETYMHSILKKYTLHLHPIQINKILISKQAHEIINYIYTNCLIIDYFTPGIKVCNEILKNYNNENVIFLINHGIIITSDNYNEVYILLEELLTKFESFLNINFNKYKFTNVVSKTINSIVNINNISYLCEDSIVNNYFLNKPELFKMDIAFPDALIYCGFKILFGLDNINNYLKLYNEYPKIIIEKEDIYIYSINLSKCKEIEDVLKSNIIILDTTLEKNFLSMDEICFLNNWDAEKYRKNL
jgi:FMN phosphatase YigB (HAD superfamily)/ribulose-5-phosphate 4-epimerase/fuculose-1-phosphate aldolase